MLQNLGFLVPQKDECGIGLSLDTHSVGICSFLETGHSPWPWFTKEETEMQREEGRGYQKYGVLLISISVPFPLPKMVSSVPWDFAEWYRQEVRPTALYIAQQNSNNYFAGQGSMQTLSRARLLLLLNSAVVTAQVTASTVCTSSLQWKWPGAAGSQTGAGIKRGF